jgi:hypothetical protein
VQTPDRKGDRRDHCLVALCTWDYECRGPHTATAYMHWRARQRLDLPHRNTIARTLGSWRRALEACGLPIEDARPTEAIHAARLAGNRRRQRVRRVQRARVLEAVTRCRGDLGRWPRTLEFLRWRLENARESPSQATIYRLFPGGWSEVIAAAQEAELKAQEGLSRAK